MKPLTLMSDAELLAELATHGHHAQPPRNSHLSRGERTELAAGEPAGAHGLCPEAEERLALRSRLWALRSQVVISRQH